MSVETTMRELNTLHLSEKSAISLEKPESEYILHIDSQLRFVCSFVVHSCCITHYGIDLKTYPANYI